MPSTASLSALFDTVDLVRTLEPYERDVVARVAIPIECEDGRILVAEGEHTASLFLIENGTAEVVKTGATEEDEFAIATMDEGAFFGEMSFIDEEPASATVRASGPARIWRVPRMKLFEEGPRGEAVYHSLVAGITQTISKRLRATNSSLVDSLQAQLEEERLRNRFGHFFIMTLMIFGILSIGTSLLSGRMSPVQEVVGSWAYLLTFLFPLVYYYTQYSDISPDDFGLRLEDWPRQVAEALTCVVGLTLVMIPIKTQFYAGEAFFSFRTMQSYSDSLFWLFVVLYLPHSFLQEFIARGLIQGSLHRFMLDTPAWVPIAGAAFLFGIGHVHYSYAFAGLTFFTSLLFGGLYYRHESMIGVTIVHYLAGLAAMAMGLF